MKDPKGRRNCECIVTPPAFRAAMPVGATTTNGLWVRAPRFFRNVVLPVPAFPVRKICAHVLLMNRTARSGMLSWSTSAVKGSLFLSSCLHYCDDPSGTQDCKFVKCRVQIKTRQFFHPWKRSTGQRMSATGFEFCTGSRYNVDPKKAIGHTL